MKDIKREEIFKEPMTPNIFRLQQPLHPYMFLKGELENSRKNVGK